MASRILLKLDALGGIERVETAAGLVVIRSPDRARHGLRWLATRLAMRETRALARLDGLDGVPKPLGRVATGFARSWLDGAPLHRGPRPDRAFFRNARRLLNRLHRAGITHNDLAKEANWIRRTDGRCGIIDFQLATAFHRRHRWFRVLAREDLRHLLKHKRRYLPDVLTARERALLARRSLPAAGWRHLVKPVYRVVTRRMLGWPERVGAEERGALPAPDEPALSPGQRPDRRV